MLRKTVKCNNCGFLARHKGMSFEQLPKTHEERKMLKDLGWYDAHETTQQQRDQIYEDRINHSYSVFCTRHMWSEWDFTEDWDLREEGGGNEVEKALNQTLNSPRKCLYFSPYTSGYSPIEHRELQREAKTQKLLIIGMLLAALIGAVAAIVAQIIAS